MLGHMPLIFVYLLLGHAVLAVMCLGCDTLNHTYCNTWMLGQDSLLEYMSQCSFLRPDGAYDQCWDVYNLYFAGGLGDAQHLYWKVTHNHRIV